MARSFESREAHRFSLPLCWFFMLRTLSRVTMSLGSYPSDSVSMLRRSSSIWRRSVDWWNSPNRASRSHWRVREPWSRICVQCSI